ncbi:hypothetical protein GOV12_02550 [Candidatus Pacearchaeota archaeon]|nr:hypothetical protein [Candidatus Pacearchaeota archaeon]
MKEKKGQITIFIILALAIAIVLLLIFMRGDQFNVVTSPKAPVDLVRDCMEFEINKSVSLVMKQGGSIDPELFILYEDERIEYLCYSEEDYDFCVMQKPLLKQSIEKELKRDLEPKINDCMKLQKESLEKKGYDVFYKTPDIIVDLIPNNVIVNVDSDLKISKGEKTNNYKVLKVTKTSKFYELVMITSSILNYEARYGKSEIMTYMMYYPDIKVEKKKQSDGTNIYILTDKVNEDKFVFAVRSFSLPAGITGN